MPACMIGCVGPSGTRPTQRRLPPQTDDPRIVAVGVEWALSRGCGRVVIAHAVLPLVPTFQSVVDNVAEGTVVLVRANRDRGMPVLSIPTTTPFQFAYGSGSFDRHLREAGRRNLPARRIVDVGQATDLDTPEDFERLRQRIASGASMGR